MIRYSVLLIVFVFANPLLGQTVHEREKANEDLNGLQRYLPKIQHALQAGDARGSFTLIQELSTAVAAINLRLYRAENQLKEFERLSSARGDSDTRLLVSIAQLALDTKDDDKANLYARRALDNMRNARGDDLGAAIFYANHVLGFIALHAGDVASARHYLLESAKTPGSILLNKRGPNTALARELLLRGEQETVMQYLDLCKKWSNRPLIENWQATIRGGAVPDFGYNLQLRP